ncbi:MAG: hypothetical protein AAF804_01225 [Bacteroidota bacterium]
MKRAWILLLLASCSSLIAQIRTDVGINLTPLLVNSLDVQAEWQLAPTFSLVANTGLRYQTLDAEQDPMFGVLASYVQPSNFGTYLGISGRFFNQEVNEYQYPFIQFGLVGSYYNETLMVADQSGDMVSVPAQGFQLGVTSTIGFTIRLTERAKLDLALQMGYSKPREDVLIYYLPGLGYSTYGVDFISVKGAHLTPMVTFKYNILQTKRERIRNME